MSTSELRTPTYMEVDEARDASSTMLVRPLFFYNTNKNVGERLGLHLFEPRFKEMISRVWTTALELRASSAQDADLAAADVLATEFLFLPNFVNYEASPGDVGLIARLDDVQIFPDGRAALQATLTRWVVVRHHWVEDGTYGLHYALCAPLGGPPPLRGHVMDLSRALCTPHRWSALLAALPSASKRRRRYVFHTSRANWFFPEPRAPLAREARALPAGTDVEVIELREVAPGTLGALNTQSGVRGPTVCARIRFCPSAPRLDAHGQWPAGAPLEEGWAPRWFGGIEFLVSGRVGGPREDIAAAIETLGIAVEHPASFFRHGRGQRLNNPERPTVMLRGPSAQLAAARSALGERGERGALFLSTPAAAELVALLPVVLAFARQLLDVVSVPGCARNKMMQLLRRERTPALIARCRERRIPREAFVFGMEKRDIAKLLVDRLTPIEIARELLSNAVRSLPVRQLFGNDVATSCDAGSAKIFVEKLVWPAPADVASGDGGGGDGGGHSHGGFGTIGVDASMVGHPLEQVWAHSYGEACREERVAYSGLFTAERAHRDAGAVRDTLGFAASGLETGALGSSPFIGLLFAGSGWKVSECKAPPRQILVGVKDAEQRLKRLSYGCQWPRLRLLLLWDVLDEETSHMVGDWLL